MTDKLLEALQIRHGNVIHYESYPDSPDGINYFFFNVDIFTKPMFVFHILRKLAIFFDRMAIYTRSIIHKNTERKDELRFQYKGEK